MRYAERYPDILAFRRESVPAAQLRLIKERSVTETAQGTSKPVTDPVP